MGVHSDIELSFYFRAFPQHFKESSRLSLLKCSERKVILSVIQIPIDATLRS